MFNQHFFQLIVVVLLIVLKENMQVLLVLNLLLLKNYLKKIQTVIFSNLYQNHHSHLRVSLVLVSEQDLLSFILVIKVLYSLVCYLQVELLFLVFKLTDLYLNYIVQKNHYLL